MTKIMAIDPGVHQLAVAVGSSVNRLEYLALWKPYEGCGFEEMLGYIIRYIPRIFRDWAITDIVIEYPQIYAGYSGVRTADIRNLIAVAGACMAASGGSKIVKKIFVAPHEWKGSIPKKIHQRRMLQNWPESVVQEICRVSPGKILDHNLIDAVGILDWYANKSAD